MIDSSVVFIDSGIGGLPYLQWVRENRPSQKVVYVADTKNFPYGERSAAEVRKAVVSLAENVIRAGSPRLLVIACNTASVLALEDIRKLSPVPVVGTVPAVKPAAAVSSSGKIGVLATEGTVNSVYLDHLVKRFAGNLDVLKVAAGDIVRYVEEQWIYDRGIGAYKIMSGAVSELVSAGVDSIVLGCTHFLHVTETIKEICGPEIRLVDSRDGVGKRILYLLDHSDKPATGSPESENGFFYISGGCSEKNCTDRYRDFALRYNLEWGGELENCF
jgi:glutamate racemase